MLFGVSVADCNLVSISRDVSCLACAHFQLLYTGKLEIKV